MKIFPFSRGSTAERQRQRALDDHWHQSNHGIDVLHQALRETLDLIGEIHEVGAENALAMQRVTQWLEKARPPIDQLNFKLVDDNVIVDRHGSLSRQSVEDGIAKAMQATTDARMTSNHVARHLMIQEAARLATAAFASSRRGYVDRQPSQPYPGLAVHAMDFDLRLAPGCSAKDARLAEEKIRDLYSEGLGIAIDRDMKDLTADLALILERTPGVVSQALQACDPADLPLDLPAPIREIEEDDDDLDPDPMI